MTEALQYFYYFFDKAVDLVFNDLAYFPGVTLGWICVTVFVFSVLMHNVLALPRVSPSTHVVPRESNVWTVSKRYSTRSDDGVVTTQSHTVSRRV